MAISTKPHPDEKQARLCSSKLIAVLGFGPFYLASQIVYWLLVAELLDEVSPLFATKLHAFPGLVFLNTFRWTRGLEAGHVAATALWVVTRVIVGSCVRSVMAAKKLQSQSHTPGGSDEAILE